MEAILTALSILTQPLLFLYMILGVAAGLVAGALPGISATMAMALFTPLTFTMDRYTAFAVLCAIYVGAISGGQYSAILLRIPGTNASIATTFDAFPLARQGKASEAIGMALVSSFIGSCVGFIFMSTCSSLLAKFALKFGPAEYFAVSLLGLSTIASLLGESVTRGLVSALFGLLLSTIGIDPISGAQRFTFNNTNLMGGIALIPVLLGIFAIPQVLQDVREKHEIYIKSDTRLRTMIPKLSELKRHWKNFLRSSLLGTWIGILPGAGSTTAALISYDQAHKASKNPETFGKGNIEGVIAAETANNAVIGGAFIPTLTLGIPGDSPLAVMLAALTIHGLQAGPLLFKTNPEDISLIMMALWVSSILMILLGLFGAKFFIQALKIPKPILLPIIVCLCSVGSYALNQNWFDVFVMLGLGFMAYGMNALGFPTGPVALGLILGPLVELNLRRAIQISNTGVKGIVSRPLTAIVLIITAFNLVYPVFKGKIKQKRKKILQMDSNATDAQQPISTDSIEEDLGQGTPGASVKKSKILGICLCGFAVVYGFLAFRIKTVSTHGGTSVAYSPVFFPAVISVLLFAVGLVILFADNYIYLKKDLEPIWQNKKVRTQYLFIILYPFFMITVGFVASTFVFICLSIHVLSTKYNWKKKNYYFCCFDNLSISDN